MHLLLIMLMLPPSQLPASVHHAQSQWPAASCPAVVSKRHCAGAPCPSDSLCLSQEVKAQNARLISIFQRPDSVSRLVHYVTMLAPDCAPQRRFRYPFAACEILCSEVDPLMDTLVSAPGILDELFAPLRDDSPPDCLLAGYCARIVATLVVRRGIQLLAWLQVGAEPWSCSSTGSCATLLPPTSAHCVPILSSHGEPSLERLVAVTSK